MNGARMRFCCEITPVTAATTAVTPSGPSSSLICFSWTLGPFGARRCCQNFIGGSNVLKSHFPPALLVRSRTPWGRGPLHHCCFMLFSIFFHGLPTGGLPTSNLVVVKINAGGGNPFRDLVVVILGGVITLWVAELAVVVFFSDRVSRGSDGSDVFSYLGT